MCQRPVNVERFADLRVSHGGMTFDSVFSLVIVIGLLTYLVAALIFPNRF